MTQMQLGLTSPSDATLRTDWFEEAPPMLGWWETAVIDSGMTIADLLEIPNAPIWRRWWGAVHGESFWSAAVTPLANGNPMIKAALTRASIPQGSRIVWRGLRHLPGGEMAYPYPLRVHSLEQANMTFADLAERWKGLRVNFNNVQPRERVRVQARSVMPPAPAPTRRERVQIQR